MEWNDLWVALALLLVFEGIMPFLSPPTLKRTMASIIELDDKTLRVGGLIVMISGVALLYLLRGE